ncbi:MAG: porin family protein [Candidatus Krumholzibacteriia bacterium]
MIRSRAFFITVLVLALVVGQASAGTLGKGIKAGISYAKVTNDFAGDSDYDLGVAAGISLSYTLVPGLTLQPELLYVQQGGKYDTTIVDGGGNVLGTGDFIWDLNYIQLPVLARLNLPVVGTLLPTIIAGPALSFMASSGYSMEQNGNTLGSGDLEDVKSTDLSLIVGLGFKVGAGPAGVTVDARYNIGSTNLNDAGTDVTIKNRGFQVLAGFQF